MLELQAQMEAFKAQGAGSPQAQQVMQEYSALMEEMMTHDVESAQQGPQGPPR